jgi:hypothetical protein
MSSPLDSFENEYKPYNTYDESDENDDSVTPSKSIPISARSQEISPSASRKDKDVMDPFEVRIRFTQHLQHLNASITSANKAAQYALKYKDMDEDLHSCILEQLERVSHPF